MTEDSVAKPHGKDRDLRARITALENELAAADSRALVIEGAAASGDQSALFDFFRTDKADRTVIEFEIRTLYERRWTDDTARSAKAKN